MSHLGGQIELITGCMFSGKTSLLMRRIREARAAGLEIRTFKHGRDNRYDPAQIVAHTGERLPAVPVTRMDDVLGGTRPGTAVAIDEIHFFGPDLVAGVLALKAGGSQVWLAGLDRDCWGQPFEHVAALVRVADRVCRLAARCARCGAEATLSQRTRALRSASDIVGGPEAYEPRCPACFSPPDAEPIAGAAAQIPLLDADQAPRP